MAFKKLSLLQKWLLKKNHPREYQDYKLMLQLQEAPIVNLEIPAGDEIHFKHSGNAGDVIYALPTVYALGKNKNIHLHLNANRNVVHDKGVYHPLGNVMLNEKTIGMLEPLLRYQDAIAGCKRYDGGKIDVDLDLFRSFPLFRGQGNLARWYFYIFAIQADLSEPWLTAPSNEQYAPYIVIARSHRYRNPGIDFSFLSKHAPLLFVGLPEEYEDMKKMLPALQYQTVADFLELATIINSCRLFIGNQSFPFSIAEALKIRRVLEVCYYCPNVNVEGANGFDFCYQPQFEKIVERALEIHPD